MWDEEAGLEVGMESARWEMKKAIRQHLQNFASKRKQERDTIAGEDLFVMFFFYGKSFSMLESY